MAAENHARCSQDTKVVSDEEGARLACQYKGVPVSSTPRRIVHMLGLYQYAKRIRRNERNGLDELRVPDDSEVYVVSAVARGAGSLLVLCWRTGASSRGVVHHSGRIEVRETPR